MLHEKTEKLQSDLNASGKQVRCISIYVPFGNHVGGTVQRHHLLKLLTFICPLTSVVILISLQLSVVLGLLCACVLLILIRLLAHHSCLICVNLVRLVGYQVSSLQDINKRLQEYNTSLQQYNSKLQADASNAAEANSRIQKEKAAIMENLSTLRGTTNSLNVQLATAKVGF